MAALAELERQAAEAQEEWYAYREQARSAEARAEAAEAEVERLTAALREIGAQQQKTLAVIESNGFVFDSIGKEPGNWQHLAFTIYTDLCQVDTIAHQTLNDGVLAAGPSKVGEAT
jgi:ATPase subunit of ABC transporter with duplicated ATPase domains